MTTDALAPARSTPRSDQLRNRASLLAAARRLCREARGLDVSAAVIAAEAGLQTRTFYRHFPSKEALFLAMLDDMSTMAREQSGFAAEIEEPRAAFDAVFISGCGFDEADLSVYDALTRSSPELRERSMQISADVLGPHIETLRESGGLRGDASPRDIVALMRMVAGIEDPGERRRLAGIIIDGLGPRPEGDG